MEKKMYFVGYNGDGTYGGDNYEVVLSSDIDRVYGYVSDRVYDEFDSYYHGIDEEDYDSEEDYYEALNDMRDSVCTSFVEIFDPNNEDHARVLAEDGYIELR